MTLTWDQLIAALGEPETSAAFIALLSGIGEQPAISEAPKEYNDPSGTARFYRFPASGVEFGIRNERLHHIHFFIHADEGYGAYVGPLPQGIEIGADEGSIVNSFGPPAKSGGGKASPLLGFIHKWVKYNIGAGRAIRFEFSREGKLRRSSVMLDR